VFHQELSWFLETLGGESLSGVYGRGTLKKMKKKKKKKENKKKKKKKKKKIQKERSDQVRRKVGGRGVKRGEKKK